MEPALRMLSEISEPSRLAIAEHLRAGAKTVNELVALTGLKQPNVSNHLAKMRCQGIVVGERAGRTIAYRLTPAAASCLPRMSVPALEPCAGAQGCELDAWANRYREAILAHNETEAREVLFAWLEHGHGLDDLYLHIFQPALRHVGDAYLAGELTEADEHFASNLTERLMAYASQFYAPRLPKGRLAVLGAVAGNRHDIGLRMLADILDVEGWSTRYLGADVPTDSFVRMVVAEHPDLVLVSCATPEQLPALRGLVERLKELQADVAHPFQVWVGGPVFAHAEGLDLPAVESAADLAEFRKLLETKF